MTREEAIEILWRYDVNFEPHPPEEVMHAIDMAIEALSREQKKYDAICDDLLKLKSDLNLPIEVAIAYEKSIGVVRKYAEMGGSK